MTLPRLLAELAMRGIELSAQDGRLLYRCARGGMMPELREALLKHKPELLVIAQGKKLGFEPVAVVTETGGVQHLKPRAEWTDGDGDVLQLVTTRRPPSDFVFELWSDTEDPRFRPIYTWRRIFKARPSGACHSCGGHRFWRSDGSAWQCVRCGPSYPCDQPGIETFELPEGCGLAPEPTDMIRWQINREPPPLRRPRRETTDSSDSPAVREAPPTYPPMVWLANWPTWWLPPPRCNLDAEAQRLGLEAKAFQEHVGRLRREVTERRRSEPERTTKGDEAGTAT